VADNTVVPAHCTARPRRLRAASRPIWSDTSFTASNAVAPATPWTCGHRRTAWASMMRPSTCANASTSHCPPCRRHHGTGKRKP